MKLNLSGSCDSLLLSEVESSDDDFEKIDMKAIFAIPVGGFSPADSKSEALNDVIENTASVNKKHVSNDFVDSPSSEINADRQNLRKRYICH